MSSDMPRGADSTDSPKAAQSGELRPAIIVFDGVCNLCSGWVQFLLQRDQRGIYRFAAMQSARGQALLRAHGLDPEDPASFLLLRDGLARTDSDAILAVLHGLGGIWCATAVARAIPRALRDPLYRWIARNRYRLFGRRQVCWMPSPATASRFLD